LVHTDNRQHENFANGILDLDSRIFSVIIAKIPGGATLAESVRPEMQSNFGSLSKRTDGMIGKWMILAFSAMERIEKAKWKSKYVSVGRENHKGMVFPAEIFGGVMIGLKIEMKTECTEIYELVMKFVEENFRLVGF